MVILHDITSTISNCQHGHSLVTSSMTSLMKIGVSPYLVTGVDYDNVILYEASSGQGSSFTPNCDPSRHDGQNYIRILCVQTIVVSFKGQFGREGSI